MKLLVCGSRQLGHDCYDLVAKTIDRYFPERQVIVHGGARGGDQLAGRYAREKHLREIIIRPDYRRYAPHLAPIMRNTQLVERADAVLALFAGSPTKGTKNTMDKALAAGKHLVALDVANGAIKIYPRRQTLWG